MSGNKNNEELMAHAKKDARRAMDAAKAKFQQAQGHVNKYMKSNPVRSAMIAAGIGAAIGAAVMIAVGRRRERKE